MEVQLGRRLWKTPFPQFSQVNEKIRDNASSWFPKIQVEYSTRVVFFAVRDFLINTQN